MTLLEALIEIRDKQRQDSSSGIRINVELALASANIDVNCEMGKLLRVMRMWPKRSGAFSYPVPHPTIAPMIAYDTCDLWDKSTEYGRNRWELLGFLIKELSK